MLLSIGPALSANWAQLAGKREQNTARPYIPDQWQRDRSFSARPMWSARWGHAVVVLNQTAARPYLTEDENSERARGSTPVLVLLGGDDGLPRGKKHVTLTSEMGIGSGKLRNDVWVGKLSSGSQSSWRVDDGSYVEGDEFNNNLIRSEMKWIEATPGRIPPTMWSSGRLYSKPLTQEDWIACQDSIKDKLVDPSICVEPPSFCYDDITTPGCIDQAVWKRDNMWSPRRGLGAAVANDNMYVIGGQAREYARIDDIRLVGGIAGQRRVETARDHSTIREDLLLKNDVWVSDDGEGSSWTLVNPGCRDSQEDVLLQTEVWSRDITDPSLPQIVGSLGSKCYQSDDCYGVAECKNLGNTLGEKVCMCPMFSPREHHTVSVQHRYSIQEDGSVISQDVIYVVGGFITVKQAFCADRSCGPSDGYKVAIDDAWMSSDGGVTWIQIRPAFSTQSPTFRGRGGHTAVVVNGHVGGNATKADKKDRLLIFGGETSHPRELSTMYLNDVWQVTLPTEPCCISSKGCDDSSPVQNTACQPSQSDWKLLTHHAEWPERSFHTSVYEPPASSNAFRHRIYLSGGRNSATTFSDSWTWWIGDTGRWKCDFGEVNSTLDSFLSIDSPLSMFKKFQLPPLNNSGQLVNFTSTAAFDIVSDTYLSVMSSNSINTIHELASADLYTVLKLRGFDYPGRFAKEIPNICFLRDMAIAFVEKCALKVANSSLFHRSIKRIGHSLNTSPSIICGRGGDSQPCMAKDWDGCTPIPNAETVDVHGLGDVAVPQMKYNVPGAVEELFCRQAPGHRYLGASAYVDNKVVVLGGITDNATRLHRDVWARDEVFPRAIITAMPESYTPQSIFFFDSNEAGAHVFEYKLLKEDNDLTPWTTTTKSIGVDVSWLDDKKGGPGQGWYTLYVRAIDPSGNRDVTFSTQANVYKWYYVPPVPWGAVAGGVFTSLVLIFGGYYEYRRRKRRATLQRFALRRLRRKFKLKQRTDELFHQYLLSSASNNGNSSHRNRRRAEIAEQSSSRQSSSRRHDDRNGRGSYRSRSHSRSRRSRSKSRYDQRDIDHSHGLRMRQKQKITAEDEERRRRRRDREKKNHRRNRRDYDDYT